MESTLEKYPPFFRYVSYIEFHIIACVALLSIQVDIQQND